MDDTTTTLAILLLCANFFTLGLIVAILGLS